MTDTERYRRSAELHESAHAVVGWTQGQRIRMIVIRPRAEGLAGFVAHDPPVGLSPLEAAIVELTTTEAGDIGDELLRFAAEPVRPTDEVGYVAATERWIQVLPDQDRAYDQYALSDATDGEHIDDEAASAAIVAKAAPAEGVWLLALARARAARLIAEHRGSILALAAELSRRPILDGPTAEAIIEAAERSAA